MFYKCKSLKYIDLPANLTILPSRCFEGSGLIGIEIPGSVVDINSNAFWSCSDLKSVVLPNSKLKIRNRAFMYTDIKGILIPPSTDYVSPDAFDIDHNFLVIGRAGSYAETFARDNACRFRSHNGYICGDANSDEYINLADVSLILKHVANWDVKISEYAADTDLDNEVDLGDVSFLLKHIAGWKGIYLT